MQFYFWNESRETDDERTEGPLAQLARRVGECCVEILVQNGPTSSSKMVPPLGVGNTGKHCRFSRAFILRRVGVGLAQRSDPERSGGSGAEPGPPPRGGSPRCGDR